MAINVSEFIKPKARIKYLSLTVKQDGSILKGVSSDDLDGEILSANNWAVLANSEVVKTKIVMDVHTGEIVHSVEVVGGGAPSWLK